MFDFLKTFGQGLLYLILSPFFLVYLALYAIYSIGVFLFMFIKRVIMFFKGEDMKDEMKIDKISHLHLENQDAEKEALESIRPTPIVPPTQTLVQPVIIQTDSEGRLKDIKIVNTQNKQHASLENTPIEAISSQEVSNDKYLSSQEGGDYDD
jgi:hypothetical protein